MRKFQKGSALVGVVAFTLIISVSGASYLMLSGSGSNDETQALVDAQALQAAESGLLIGTRWLRAQDPLPSSNLSDIFSTSPLVVNGISVVVDVINDDGNLSVRAEASDNDLPYSKRLEWDVAVETPGNKGVFVSGTSASGQVGGGGFNNVTMDGPFHTNDAIVYSSVSNASAGGAAAKFVNGVVSTFNKTTLTNFDKSSPFTTGDWGAYGDGVMNNYDFGVFKHSLNQNESHGSDLDAHFTDIFRHSQDSLYVASYYSPDLVLDSSASDPGSDETTTLHRPTLNFNSNGSADYYYWTKSGNNWTSNHVALANTTINGKLLRVPGSGVNVLGTVKGKIAVMTDSGYSIFPTGDLRLSGFTPLADSYYDDYNNTGNYGIGDTAANPNVLGLISGKNLHFTPEWVDTTNHKVDVGVSGQDMFVQAMVVTARAGGTVMWNLKNNGDVELNGSKPYRYNLRFIGSRTMNQWFNYTAGGTGTNDAIRFYYDTRLGNIAPPKMPVVKASDGSVGGLWDLNPTNWTETNI